MYRLVLDFFIKLSFTFLKKNKLRLILNYLSPKKKHVRYIFQLLVGDVVASMCAGVIFPGVLVRKQPMQLL